ncbi:putative permease [Sphaerochaeta pleomorpha str. Grapes]|uniref:Probable membrane transporter protein n=1 Tax=Sphaerochaeta pleomorpha (strain ATCC BAA-1885 / DSM 22778 / Grapes) TaxID=158190 RepID=G8QUB6_SPHPG|nr:sulfite exporter TauE/SafE family protein [Sphaerochaeta pleomorpha]AEV28086.1 putative permease [Sphaerochaeta pleomorpha str. Grapes]
MDWLLVIAVFCAFFVKGLVGFANTLVFTSILSFGTSNLNISPLELLLNYPANFYISWKERAFISWKYCLPISLLVLLGILPGVFLLKMGKVEVIKIVFGFVVVFLGLDMFLQGRRETDTKPNRIFLAIVGLLSGLLCGLFGIGALLSAYIGRTTDSTKSFKGNLCVVFFIENTFRIIMYSVTGILTFSTLKLAILLYPVMFLSLFAGMKASDLFNEQTVKKTIYVMLILSGLSLVLTNVVTLFR